MEIDLLGEPRLKNGLTYYPGVLTDDGSVILGNIVRLQLMAEGSQPYIGYGFLKGLWLWRDQPYMRVQYMAPTRMDLPRDAIAYRAAPDASGIPELMVTNRVGDLHLNALLGPVYIEGSPLMGQLFQENVGASADGFILMRHLDPAVQRVQPLDEAFRLTPIVQAFPKTVLRAMLVPLASSKAPELRVPKCGGSSSSSISSSSTAPVTPATPHAAPPAAALPSTSRPSTVVPTMAPSPAAPHAAATLTATLTATPDLLEREREQVANGWADGRTDGRTDGRRADAVTPAPAPLRPPNSSAEDMGVMASSASNNPTRSPMGVGSSRLTNGDLARLREHGLLPVHSVVGDDEDEPRESPGLGPKGSPAAILLQATLAGRGSVILRCPIERQALREKLASVFGLVSASVRILYGVPNRTYRELPPIEWREFGDGETSTALLYAALERQPELKALPVQVSGEAVVHLPWLHYLSSLLALANLAGAFAFGYVALWSVAAPAPYIFLVGLPPLMLAYNSYACIVTMNDEYLLSAKLRTALDRKDDLLVCLMLLALCGPDVFLFACRTQLPAFGAALSLEAERQLLIWAFGLHWVQDVPMLACNVLMHGSEFPWDGVSLVVLGLSILSLTYNLAWHVYRLMRVSPEDDLLELAPPSTAGPPRDYVPGARSKLRQKSMQHNPNKYVALNDASYMA
jgi:hypothetical protein